MEQNNHHGALQKALKSGFNAQSTTNEIIRDIDLTGKIAVITGGNTGIGLETVNTRSLAGAVAIF